MLDKRLAPNALALHPRAADGFVAVFARRMHDIKRHAGHIGDHNGAVGRLALYLRRAGIGVRLGAGITRLQQLLGKLGHHIAVFGMDHSDAAKLAQTAEAGE